VPWFFFCLVDAIRGLARSFTGAIERGEKDLRLTTLVKLANTFRIPVGQLFK
jgi:DNA-binding XRE family transcriptional regulator